ncbi:MAG TPA: glycosyltransferase family 9 protein [Bacteroidales bacterium]
MKKILLIRFSSIGDIVLTTPVVRALKQQSACELHILTKKQYAFIYQNNPNVDKVHFFEKETSEIIDSLKKENFDFVVDLQKNLRSIKVRRILGKPSASFPKLNKEKWLLVNFNINHLPEIHIVDRYFEAVKELGVKNDWLGLDYFIPEKDEVELKKFLPGIQSGFVAFVTGGRHNTKIFPPEKMSSVISKLEFPVVLLGGKEDVERGEEVLENITPPQPTPKGREEELKSTSKAEVYNLCGKLNLNQSASLIRQSNLVITNDTGLMHIAAAFNKPIISIWGNTVPQFGMYPYLPGSEELSFISEVNNLKCRPCSKLGYSKCPKRHFNCMMLQDESVIVEQAKLLFGK